MLNVLIWSSGVEDSGSRAYPVYVCVYVCVFEDSIISFHKHGVVFLQKTSCMCMCMCMCI